MNDETQTPQDQDSLSIADSSASAQRLEADEPDKKWTVKEMWNDLTPKEKRGAKVGLAVGAGVVGTVVALGASGAAQGNAVYDNTTQQQDPNAPQNFENGPLPPEETETPGPTNPEPSPSPTEIPSPTQQSVDIQLPTLPSPETH